ncbi:unnamed protein product [Cuscuta epithymum]|uniref:Uncharacterized protein n=1 Tax=Cuscuta epithymum TaxID=186058 RepID=A0AAV0BVM8_9ASTE|nr:unnamed protein product [Cuscuta epithymum]
MKNSQVTGFVKQVISRLTAVVKSKSDSIRSKTGAIKARIQLFSLLKSRKLCLQGRIGIGSISHKIHALLEQHAHCEDEDTAGKSPASVSNSDAAESESGEAIGGEDRSLLEYNYQEEEEDDKYPDLRHSLFEEEEGDDEMLGDPNGSAIEMVRNSKEEGGEEFRLEDEIDNVADLFIRKFHKRMRLQRLESLKRVREMLQRST